MAQLDRLFIEKGEREKLYDKIEIFGEKSRKEQFLFAMAFGFKNKIKRPLGTKEGFFLTKDLRVEDEALMDIVAVYDTGSADILSDRGEVFKIAEEYAHAGIHLLHEEISSIEYGSFNKYFERYLYETLNGIEH